jgi:hypothetical protein
MSSGKNGVEVFFDTKYLEVKHNNGEEILIPYDKISFVSLTKDKESDLELFRVEIHSGKTHTFYTVNRDFGSRLRGKLNLVLP